ncbi:MAG: hypothetical protein H6744_01445 [Deltaproteobacteria bacterium]|nr:hypothetical protein [Deltaproteobacteria bacterium]
MSGWKRFALVVTLGAALAGCHRTPSEAYIDMTTSAQMGDREGFLAGFTQDSRDLVEALITLSEAYGMSDSNPYELLVFDTVEEEQVEDDRAVLVVRRRATTRKILMVRDEDEWRIDTKQLEAFWDKEGRQ